MRIKDEFLAVLDALNEAEIDKRTVPVVGLESLIAMKETAGRPNDLRDIDELKRIRSEGEG